MKNTNDRLAAKVAATNQCNAEAARLYAVALPSVRALVGQKIIKVDGSLTTKARKAMNADLFRSYNCGFQIYKLGSNYSLAFVVKCSVNNESGSCSYAETAVYLGELDGQTLAKTCEDRIHARSDWTVAEVLALRQVAADAAEASRNAESALSPFGRYDH